MESDIKYTGNLRSTPFGNVLLLIQKQKETGSLHLRRDKVYKKLLFQGGELVFAVSGMARESFLRYCLSKKLIKISQAIKLAEAALTSQAYPEQVAGQRSFMDSVKLTETYHEIVKARVLEVFSWRQGEYFFNFDEDLNDDEEALSSSYNTVDLIREGIAGHMDTARIRSFLRKDLSSAPELKVSREAIISDLKLKPSERKLLDIIDGKHTVEDIIAESTTSLKETLKFVFLLVVLGFASLDEGTLDHPETIREKAADAKDFTLDVLEFSRLVETEFSRIVGCNYFEIFNISRDFEEDDLRRMYYTWAQKLRPEEHYQRAADVVKRKSDEIFRHLSRAYETLSEWNKERRLGRFEDFRSTEERLRSSKLLTVESERDFLQGRELLELEDYKGALEMFESAASTKGEEGEYWAYLGNTMLRINGDREKAFGYLRRSTAYDSNLVQGYKFLSDYYKSQGIYEAALENMRKALRLRPDSKALRKGYKALESIAAKESGKVGAEDDERNKVEKRMKEFLDLIEGANHFQMLGLETGASMADVKKAYFRLAKEFHPDRLAKISASLVYHPMAEKIFQLLSEAYENLSSEQRREVYERTLVIKQEEAKLKTEQKRQEEDRIFRKGLAALNDGDYVQALELFNKAKGFRNDVARYHAYANWAEFNAINPGSIAESARFEKKFREIAQMDKKCEDTYLLWGKMYRKMDNPQAALNQFNKAIQINPKCVDAVREIRLINMRQQRNQKSSGLDLRGLFGRKKSE